MNKTSLTLTILTLGATLGLSAVLPALAQDAPAQPTRQEARPGQPEGRPGRGRGTPGEGGREAPSVERSMKGMGRALRQLRAQVSDPAKKDENLKLIGDMQTACIVAKNQRVPEKALGSAIDEASKAKMAVEYRADLLKVARRLLDIEESILDGKSDAAATMIDEVVQMRDEAHKELGIKDDDENEGRN